MCGNQQRMDGERIEDSVRLWQCRMSHITEWGNRMCPITSPELPVPAWYGCNVFILQVDSDLEARTPYAAQRER